MNNKNLFVVFAILLTSCNKIDDTKEPPKDFNQVKIAVASDLHLFDNTLLEAPGLAWDKALKEDPKLFIQSEEILDKMISDLIQEKPDVLIIPGDITKDGELSSHQKAIKQLQKLRQNGIKVLVIPGNHDINNPLAVRYNGDNATPVDHITPQQFKELYKDFGYDPAQVLEFGPELCYVAEPIQGLWVLGIDGCIYKNNIAENSPCVAGELDAVRMKWITDKAKEGKDLGKKMIVMMHHGLIEHFTMQSTVAEDFLIKDREIIAEQFIESGINVVFTGHFHAQSISKQEFAQGTIYDIQTGSMISFPCPYRIVEINKEQIEIKSNHIKLNSAATNYVELYDFSLADVKAGFPNFLQYILYALKNNGADDEMIDKIQQMIPYFTPVLTEIYTNILKGDENGVSITPDAESGVSNAMLLVQLQNLITTEYPKYAPTINSVLSSLTIDTQPSDNHLIIKQ